MNFVLSDTHFGHFNILNYCNRPFTTVYEMNQYMIHQWNNLITSEDTVYHLGDFGFGGKDYIESIVKQLHGYKILILGNHDKHGLTWFSDVGFDHVYKKPITTGNYILSHQPILNLSYDIINIHGHIHNSDPTLIEGYDLDSHLNVSVDVLDFKPISFIQLLGHDLNISHAN